MGAMNQGITDSNGRVVGVTHEIFIKPGMTSRWKGEDLHNIFKDRDKRKVHLLVVGGQDLKERKKALVKNSDAIVVLPGGPGTFDKLWEMVCAKQIGLINLPIVCVNVQGYYNPFREMLERAHEEQFLYKSPGEIVHFEDTSEDAINFIESALIK